MERSTIFNLQMESDFSSHSSLFDNNSNNHENKEFNSRIPTPLTISRKSSIPILSHNNSINTFRILSDKDVINNREIIKPHSPMSRIRKPTKNFKMQTFDNEKENMILQSTPVKTHSPIKINQTERRYSNIKTGFPIKRNASSISQAREIRSIPKTRSVSATDSRANVVLTERMALLESEQRSILSKMEKNEEDGTKIIHELKAKIITEETERSALNFKNQQLEDKMFKLKRDLSSYKSTIESETTKSQHVEGEISNEYNLRLQEIAWEHQQKMDEAIRNHQAKKTAIISARTKHLEEYTNKLKTKLRSLQENLLSMKDNYENQLITDRQEHESSMADLRKSFSSNKASLKEECDEIDEKIFKATNENSLLLSLIGEQNQRNDTLKATLLEKEKTLEQINFGSDDLRNKMKSFEKSIIDKDAKIEEMEKYIISTSKEKEVTKSNLSSEETVRRYLHNRVQELKGNIRVFSRVRPPSEEEKNSGVVQMEFPDQDDEGQELSIKVQQTERIGRQNAASDKLYKFSFDKAFSMDSTNEEIFGEISQLVQSALDGYNVCIFAYGQTGSGKTYTMSSDNGMIPKTVRQIFEASENLKEKGWKYEFEGQFLEIYNENINDLLGNPNEIDKSKHEIKHNMKDQKTIVTGLVSVPLNSPEKLDSLLANASKNRSVAATQANERSSRSHSVFMLKLRGSKSTTGEVCEGQLNLIDLAGSERLSHSQATGDRLKETRAINKSLSCLGDVIYALGSKDLSHVPYRNSKVSISLTYHNHLVFFTNISLIQADIFVAIFFGRKF